MYVYIFLNFWYCIVGEFLLEYTGSSRIHRPLYVELVLVHRTTPKKFWSHPLTASDRHSLLVEQRHIRGLHDQLWACVPYYVKLGDIFRARQLRLQTVRSCIKVNSIRCGYKVESWRLIFCAKSSALAMITDPLDSLD